MSHVFTDGRCTQCRETKELVDRIGVPCKADDAAMERWWIHVVLSGGIQPTAKVRQIAEPARPVASKKAKKTAEPCLFDGFD